MFHLMAAGNIHRSPTKQVTGSDMQQKEAQLLHRNCASLLITQEM